MDFSYLTKGGNSNNLNSLKSLSQFHKSTRAGSPALLPFSSYNNSQVTLKLPAANQQESANTTSLQNKVINNSQSPRLPVQEPPSTSQGLKINNLSPNRFLQSFDNERSRQQANINSSRLHMRMSNVATSENIQDLLLKKCVHITSGFPLCNVEINGEILQKMPLQNMRVRTKNMDQVFKNNSLYLNNFRYKASVLEQNVKPYGFIQSRFNNTIKSYGGGLHVQGTFEPKTISSVISGVSNSRKNESSYFIRISPQRESNQEISNFQYISQILDKTSSSINHFRQKSQEKRRSMIQQSSILHSRDKSWQRRAIQAIQANQKNCIDEDDEVQSVNLSDDNNIQNYNSPDSQSKDKYTDFAQNYIINENLSSSSIQFQDSVYQDAYDNQKDIILENFLLGPNNSQYLECSHPINTQNSQRRETITSLSQRNQQQEQPYTKQQMQSLIIGNIYKETAQGNKDGYLSERYLRQNQNLNSPNEANKEQKKPNMIQITLNDEIIFDPLKESEENDEKEMAEKIKQFIKMKFEQKRQEKMNKGYIVTKDNQQKDIENQKKEKLSNQESQEGLSDDKIQSHFNSPTLQEIPLRESIESQNQAQYPNDNQQLLTILTQDQHTFQTDQKQTQQMFFNSSHSKIEKKQYSPFTNESFFKTKNDQKEEDDYINNKIEIKDMDDPIFSLKEQFKSPDIVMIKKNQQHKVQSQYQAKSNQNNIISSRKHISNKSSSSSIKMIQKKSNQSSHNSSICYNPNIIKNCNQQIQEQEFNEKIISKLRNLQQKQASSEQNTNRRVTQQKQSSQIKVLKNKKQKVSNAYKQSFNNSQENSQSTDSHRNKDNNDKIKNQTGAEKPNYELYDQIYSTLLEQKEQEKNTIKNQVKEFLLTPLKIYQINIFNNKEAEKKQQYKNIASKNNLSLPRPSTNQSQLSKQRLSSAARNSSRQTNTSAVRKTIVHIQEQERIVFQKLAFLVLDSKLSQMFQVQVILTQNYLLLFRSSDIDIQKSKSPLLELKRQNIYGLTSQNSTPFRNKRYQCKKYSKAFENEILIDLKQSINPSKYQETNQSHVLFNELCVNSYLLEKQRDREMMELIQSLFKQNEIKKISLAFHSKSEMKKFQEIYYI